MQSIAIHDSNEVLKGVRGAMFQLAMIAAAAALPAACHLTGAPVKVLLPMHWPVLAAGLFCGWRSGLLAGAVSPLISFALSGMPPAGYLPLMAVELSVYGFAAGFAFERLRLKPVLSVLLAVLAGRAAYVAVAAFSIPAAAALGGLLPGLPAALAQVALLPLAHYKFSKKAD